MEKEKSGRLTLRKNYKFTNRRTRFSIPALDKAFPIHPELKSGWQNEYFYAIEIAADPSSFTMWLCLSNRNAPEDIKSLFAKIIEKTKKYPSKNDWEWLTLFETSSFHFDEKTTRDQIFDALEKRFNQVVEHSIGLMDGLDL